MKYKKHAYHTQLFQLNKLVVIKCRIKVEHCIKLLRTQNHRLHEMYSKRTHGQYGKSLTLPEYQGKGKAISVQVWTDLEGLSRLVRDFPYECTAVNHSRSTFSNSNNCNNLHFFYLCCLKTPFTLHTSHFHLML